VRRFVRLAVAISFALISTLALALGAGAAGGPPQGWVARPPLHIKVLGTQPDGRPQLTKTTPTGLPPCEIAKVYNLSLSSTTVCGGSDDPNRLGSGQTIAIVDAYHDPNALNDLNVFNATYGFPKLSTCTSLAQSGACFLQVYSKSKPPKVNSNWVLEESLDIEWAHAMAPGAKILLVEAYSASFSDLLDAVNLATNQYGATVVSMSWGGSEFSGETGYDSSFTHAGTLYTVSSGDNGTGPEYPAASPNVIAVGGTTLNGCSGTSCAGFKSETAWSGSGGGVSAYEAIPAYQASYVGPVYGSSSISALTSNHRGIPDVSFEADPNTGVSVYDSTSYLGQSGWWTLGGTSVGAPSWAGILAAGQASGANALQGDSAIYGGGYSTNLRDIASGTNGKCGTDCTAGTGYDLVTGLGSPINYP
jgi:subtilase family serine protease